MSSNSFEQTFELSLLLDGLKYSYSLENKEVLIFLQFKKLKYDGVSNVKFKFWLKEENVDFYTTTPEATSLVESSFYGPDNSKNYRNDRVFKAMIEYYEKEVKN